MIDEDEFGLFVGELTGFTTGLGDYTFGVFERAILGFFWSGFDRLGSLGWVLIFFEESGLSDSVLDYCVLRVVGFFFYGLGWLDGFFGGMTIII